VFDFVACLCLRTYLCDKAGSHVFPVLLGVRVIACVCLRVCLGSGIAKGSSRQCVGDYS